MGTESETSHSARQRLVLRFAVGSLVAFVAIGVAVWVVTIQNVRQRAEENAAFHAEFVTQAVLAPAVEGIDLAQPLSGDAYTQLDSLVRDRILSDGRVVRVKIWRPDGTVVYSDHRPLVGRSYPEEAGELARVMDGHVETGVSSLALDENVAERGIDTKLFEAYLPLRPGPGEEPIAVAELYQRYSVIQDEIDRLSGALAVTFGIGLVVLFATLLPIALRASRALREQNRQLAEQADQLGALLAREQQTVAELRELNRMKGDFVSAASHELRTPLTTILGYVKTLKQPKFGDDPATRAEFLDAAEQQGNRLHRLVRNLLTAARLEEGERPVVTEQVDLARLVREIAADLPGGSRRVRLELDSAPATVETDRERLGQILTNLVENGLKFSPDDAPVDVGAEWRDGALTLWVRDRGMGIDPAEHDRIFDRFYQVDQSTTRRFAGVGLGLNLTKGLVAELGGEISVQSAPGAGSTFTVRWPLPRSGEPRLARGSEVHARSG